MAFGSYVDYELIDYTDFDTMGAGGPPGFGGFGKGGYGGLGANIQFLPITQQETLAPVVQNKQRFVQQPVLTPQPVVQSTKPIRYNAPIVTYAQPITQQVDMSAPVVQKQKLTAEAIVQPTFTTAPVTYQQAITSTAPTINKGFGAGLGLNTAATQYGAGYARQNLQYGSGNVAPVLAQNYGLGQQQQQPLPVMNYGAGYGGNLGNMGNVGNMGFGAGQQQFANQQQFAAGQQQFGMGNQEMDMDF